ncbi:MAG: dihydroneopterin aldolase [Bacteroidetes bacterium]|nr:MAG: dihydroneopterin aldolase [Bacteroidota bacterium]
MGKKTKQIVLQKGVVSVNNLEVFAYHGVHPLEQKTGHVFTVNISVEADFSEAVAGDLTQTIDYAQVAKIARKHMSVPQKLLETLVAKIAGEILSEFSMAKNVFVEIRKQHPPLPGVESVSVSGHFTRP